MNKTAFLLLSVISLAVAAPVFADTSTTSPIGYWKFDERSGNTAVDSSGNSVDLLGPNSTNWSAGRIGWSVSLNGLNVSLKNARSKNIDIPKSFSFVGWINSDILPQNRTTMASSTPIFNTPKYFAIITKGKKDNRGFELNFKDNYLNLTDLRSGIDLTSTATYGNSQWQMVAMTWDSEKKTLSFYKDGGATDSIELPEALIAPMVDDALVVGSTVAQDDRFYSGYFDDMRVYNRVLSGDEIKQLYSDQKPQVAVGFFAQLASIIQSGFKTLLSFFGF